MAINFLSNINLNKNELQLAVFQNLAGAPATPLEGQVYYNTTDDNLYVYTGAGWVDLTSQGSGSTNLTKTVTTTDVTINSSTGTNVDIGAATTSNAGVMTSALYDNVILNNAKVSNVSTNLSTSSSSTTLTVNSSDGTNAVLPAATVSVAGVMTATDKTKLDGIATGAQVNVGTNIAQGTRTTTTVPVTSSTGTDATLTAATTLLAGVMTSTDKTKLDGIATGAEVNVATNLSKTSTTTDVTINSSTGTNVAIGAATGSVAGVMTSALYNNVIANNAKVTNVTTNLGYTASASNGIVTSSDGTDATIPLVVSGGNAGLMTGTDKSKLDGIPGDIITEAEGIASNDNDTSLPTSAAVKDYVDSAVTVGMAYKGGYNASTNAPALDTGSPTVIAGDTYTVTAAGNFFTEAVQVGDVLISQITGTVAASLTNWTVLNKNIPDIVNASTTASGIVELATIAETNTGTDATRAVTPDGLDGWTGSVQIATLGTISTGAWQGTSISTTYTDAKVVSVGGTADRITIGGTAGSPAVDIASTYAGQTSITTLGTISSGTWQGTAINQTYLVGQSGTNTGDEVAATTLVAGIVELATGAEVNAGTDTSRVITPSGLVQWPGSTNITTLGTIATGVWQGTAINQTYLVGQSGTNTGDEVAATAAVQGIVELATVAEVQAGTDPSRVVTPDGLAARSVVAQILVASLVSGAAQIVHNLGTEDIIVQLFDSISKETVFADVARTTLADVASTSTIKISFGQTPANNVDVIITSARGATSVTPTYS